MISVVAFVGGPPSIATGAAGAVDPSALWSPTAQKILPAKEGHRRLVNPADYSGFTLDAKAMANRLSLAPLEDLRDPDRAGAVTITVPGPTGELIDFAVVESPIMEDALQAAHPDIRTYAGSSITEGYAASIRLDMTPFGFHASVRDGQASWYVDPAYLGDTSLYVSYFGASLPTEERLPDEVLDPEAGEPLGEGVPDQASDRVAAPRVGEGPGGAVIQRVYRLALVNDSAYAEFFAPGLNDDPSDLEELEASNAAVLAAKTTLMNRVNQIYNDDLAIKMVFVDNCPGSVSGPTTCMDRLNLNSDARETAVGLAQVSESGCTLQTLAQNQVAVDALIGPPNYDIGHIALGVAGGGVAALGSVGQQGLKAFGCTGLPTPVGDFMAIDYVAHEMGHQFGGPHTFNGTQHNCADTNRSGESSVEPGSGSSVMAYAGICRADNLQPHTDPYFSQRSQMEISDYVNSDPGDPVTDTRGGFEVITTTNHNPVVTAPADVTIPIRTPFTLKGSATDSDGDALIYLWEQNDIGAADGVQLTDNTKATGPLFRVFGTFADVSATDTLLYNSPGENLATTSPVRTFPDIAQIASGNTNAATGACPTPVASDYAGAEGTSSLKKGPILDCYSEFLPTAAYVGSGANATPPRLNFRLTARDLTANGGGTQFDDVTLTIDKSAGPFLVTSQAKPTTYDGGSTQAVTWAVNGTAGLAPNVKITMSTDGGDTFDKVLAASTPNDGSANLVIPEVITTQGWIKVEAIGNVFFDLNDAPIRVTGTMAKPVAKFGMKPKKPFISAPVTLSAAKSTGDGPLRYSWNFGDGGSDQDASGVKVTPRFAKAGYRTVTLTVTDSRGRTDKASEEILVRRAVKCRSNKVARTGSWREVSSLNAPNGQYCDNLGNQRGRDTLTYGFRGPQLDLYHGRAKQGGRAAVYIDGRRQGTVDFRGSDKNPRFKHHKVFRKLGNGKHTVRLVVLGGQAYIASFITIR